jgi:DNA polymerase-1
VGFNQLAAETGRFSAKGSIQNIPKNDEFGLRNAFRAPPGWRIIKADYKQQELRVLAQVAADKNMKEAIKNGVDLHGLAATKVFQLDCSPNEVEEKYPAERDRIKSVQFGIVYGRGPHNLARALSIPKEDAQRLIQDYFREFPAVKRFVDQIHRRVARDGFIDDIFGRRRYLPDAARKASRKKYERMTREEKETVRKISAGKREAQNFVIQGASATITKLAMIRCHPRITTQYRGNVEMILTLHDELQFLAREDVVPQFAAELPGLMCDLDLQKRFGFTVPMEVDVKVGPSWGEATKWKGGQDGSAATDRKK